MKWKGIPIRLHRTYTTLTPTYNYVPTLRGNAETRRIQTYANLSMQEKFHCQEMAAQLNEVKKEIEEKGQTKEKPKDFWLPSAHGR